MATSPTTDEKKTTPEQEGLVPPEEQFWQRYSPHHEFPLSSVGAIALHVLAVVALVALAIRWADREEDKPPKMELVEIMGGGGLGLDDLGTGKTLAGGGKGSKTDVEGPAGGQVGKVAPKDQVPVGPLRDPSVRPPDLKFPEGKGEEPVDEGAFTELDKSVKRVEESIALAMNPAPKPGTGKEGTKGPSPVPGTGGPAGKGTGKGPYVGPGSGQSPYGKVFTKQQQRQKRWRILASQDGSVHLAKLQAMNVTLVMPTDNPNVFTVFDLARNPPAPKTTTRLEEHGDKVWWTNRNPGEVGPLARLLGLRKTPSCFVIFLPRELEDRMVQLEEAHQGAREDQIAETVWDMPMRDGHYAREPVIVEQRLRGDAPVRGRPR